MVTNKIHNTPASAKRTEDIVEALGNGWKMFETANVVDGQLTNFTGTQMTAVVRNPPSFATPAGVTAPYHAHMPPTTSIIPPHNGRIKDGTGREACTGLQISLSTKAAWMSNQYVGLRVTIWMQKKSVL